MTDGAALAAALLIAVAAATIPITRQAPGGRPARARAAPIVTVLGPAGDTLDEVTPSFVIRTAGFSTSETPVLTLQLSSRADFAAPLVYDTSIRAESATVTLAHPLPERIPLYWRAIAAAGAERDTSEVAGPRRTATWLTLLFPNGANGTTVSSRRPVFSWHSAKVATPPGPWVYDVNIVATVGGRSWTARQLLDTIFEPAFELESNTSYRWSVTARLATGDTTRVASTATFVITSPDAPLATLLYQTFPNPFPSPRTGSTCIWFDLRSPSLVALDVFSLRGEHVRRIIPGNGLHALLPSGRFGRADVGSNSGCDPRFTWDGTADDGRVVPAGVYLLRLRAEGGETVRKMVFRGR